MKTSLLLLLAATLVAVTFNGCDILDPEDPGLLVPLTVDEDPLLPSISVNGTKLHAETFGNPTDPMIVVLHGGPGGDYRCMLNIRKFAADGFSVVFYDQRGSGLSRRHGKEVYTQQIFTEDLDAVIAHYRQSPTQKVILMGQSWGAMLATAYVNDHPGAINGVVMIEPGGFTWHDAEDYIKRSRALSIFDEITSDYLYLDQLLTSSNQNELDYKAALQAAADYAKGNKVGIPSPYPFWRKGAAVNIAATENAKANPFDYTTNLRQYTTKVLFVYSELNQAYGKSWAETVSSAYPNVQLAMINGTGHEVPYFGWDGFYPVARAYVNSIK